MAPPWERITVTNAFARFAHTDCESAIAEDKFDEILVEKIEPCLGVERPVFLYDYPAKYAALARTKKDDPQTAERFELYIGSLEIANGFSELTRATEQKNRFLAAEQARAEKKWSKYPLPEKFLSALDDIPSAAGIALGIDRLVMLLADTNCIDDVVAFTPETL
jgi:lysyl-tRNA synthetase class 2